MLHPSWLKYCWTIPLSVSKSLGLAVANRTLFYEQERERRMLANRRAAAEVETIRVANFGKAVKLGDTIKNEDLLRQYLRSLESHVDVLK